MTKTRHKGRNPDSLSQLLAGGWRAKEPGVQICSRRGSLSQLPGVLKAHGRLPKNGRPFLQWLLEVWEKPRLRYSFSFPFAGRTSNPCQMHGANRYEERLRNLEAHARDVEDENQRLQQRVQQLIQEQNMQKAAEKSKEEAIISQWPSLCLACRVVCACLVCDSGCCK